MAGGGGAGGGSVLRNQRRQNHQQHQRRIQPVPIATPAKTAPAKIACPECDKIWPSTQAFCGGCGGKIEIIEPDFDAGPLGNEEQVKEVMEMEARLNKKQQSAPPPPPQRPPPPQPQPKTPPAAQPMAKQTIPLAQPSKVKKVDGPCVVPPKPPQRRVVQPPPVMECEDYTPQHYVPQEDNPPVAVPANIPVSQFGGISGIPQNGAPLIVPSKGAIPQTFQSYQSRQQQPFKAQHPHQQQQQQPPYQPQQQQQQQPRPAYPYQQQQQPRPAYQHQQQQHQQLAYPQLQQMKHHHPQQPYQQIVQQLAQPALQRSRKRRMDERGPPAGIWQVYVKGIRNAVEMPRDLFPLLGDKVKSVIPDMGTGGVFLGVFVDFGGPKEVAEAMSRNTPGVTVERSWRCTEDPRLYFRLVGRPMPEIPVIVQHLKCINLDTTTGIAHFPSALQARMSFARNHRRSISNTNCFLELTPFDHSKPPN